MYLINIESVNGVKSQAEIWINRRAYPYCISLPFLNPDHRSYGRVNMCSGWGKIRNHESDTDYRVKFLELRHSKVCILKDCKCNHEHLVDRIFRDELYDYLCLKVRDKTNYVIIKRFYNIWLKEIYELKGIEPDETETILKSLVGSREIKSYMDIKTNTLEYICIAKIGDTVYDIEIPPVEVDEKKISDKNKDQLSLFDQF